MKTERQLLMLGSLESGEMRGHTKRILSLVENIGTALGKNAYLLDEYIRVIVKGLCLDTTAGIANQGSYAYTRLSGMVRDILNSNTKGEADAFSTTAKEFIAHNALPYAEKDTLRAVYSIALSDCYLERCLEPAWDKAADLLDKATAADRATLTDLRDTINATLGGDEILETLTTHLLAKLRVASYMQIFVQGYTSHLLEDCRERDMQTQRTALELWLISGIGSACP